MVAKSGDALLQPPAVVALVDEMLPLATVLTPNLPEAARLLGEDEAATPGEAAAQGRRLLALGPRAVLMKGGHGRGALCTDLLVTEDGTLRFEAARLATANTHGTGCTLSSAIAAGLARGLPLAAAVGDAHAWLHAAIRAADRLGVGRGRGPVHHFHALWRASPMPEVTVLGAGVAGLAVAAELADRGVAVAIVDRGGGPGPHACSWWAGGMLAPFCEGESAEEPVVRLGQEAAPWWQAHAGTVRARRHPRRRPRPRPQRARPLRPAHRAARDPRRRRRSPPSSPISPARFRSALFFPEEAHLDPRATLAALARPPRRAGRRRSSTGAAADGPGHRLPRPRRPRRAPRPARRQGRDAGPALPGRDASRSVRLLHPRIPLYVVPRGDGVYMLGATTIEAGERSRITARSLLEMLTAAYALHPAFGEAEVLEIGVDARPAFRDNLPRIRRRGARIYVNGLYRHGFLLAPALARMAADLVMGGPRPEVMDEDRP